MKYRKLRIAWSVVWGLAAVLLVVLWVRSFFRFDKFGCEWISTISSESGIHSWRGGLEVFHWQFQPITPMSSHLFWRTELKWAPLIRTIDTTTTPQSFEWKSWPSGWILRFPVWVLLLAVATVALLPWIHKLGYARRFSLRTLLIATTLVAAVLGIIVWKLGAPQ